MKKYQGIVYSTTDFWVPVVWMESQWGRSSVSEVLTFTSWYLWEVGNKLIHNMWSIAKCEAGWERSDYSPRWWVTFLWRQRNLPMLRDSRQRTSAFVPEAALWCVILTIFQTESSATNSKILVDTQLWISKICSIFRKLIFNLSSPALLFNLLYFQNVL